MQRLEEVYREMYEYYPVKRGELPVGFGHRKQMDLGQSRIQETYSSCGRSMAMVAMKAQKIHFNRESKAHVEWLRSLVPTRFQGIDPHPLARGITSTGVECTEYFDSDMDTLIELLRVCPSVCILAIQAPWCRLDHIREMDAGHYVAAGHVDLRKREVIVHDTGNESPWGRIKFENLPLIWHDHKIGNKKQVFQGWMLHVPVKY